VRGKLVWSRLVVPVVALLAWGGYVVLIGGDIFPARRHFVPIVVLLAMILGEVVAAPIRAGAQMRRLAVLATSSSLLLFAWGQYRDPENTRAIDERWEWDGRTAGLFLKQAFDEQQPLLATMAAGSIPFWSELPAVDLLGLNDRHIARSRPANFGEGLIGHELGDGEYVLSREPDLVLEGLAFGPTELLRSPSAIQMASTPAWKRNYVGVRFMADEPAELIFHSYARATSEKIGIRRTSKALVIPGWLFATDPRSVARLDPEGALSIALSDLTPAGRLRSRLRAGRWRVEIDTYGPGSSEIELAVEEPDGGTHTLGQGETLLVRTSGAITARLSTPSRQPIYVRSVSLHRSPADPSATR